MGVDNQLHDLNVRVSVLEQKHQNAEDRMALLKKEIDLCKADHTKTSDKLEARMSVVENVVDDLRINTELTRQALQTLERLHEGQERNNESLSAIQRKLSRQDGIIAAAVVIGGGVWGLLMAFKDQILRFFGW